MYEDARRGGFDECVTISPDGQLWEGSRTNLFVVADGATPDSALLRARSCPGSCGAWSWSVRAGWAWRSGKTPLSLFDRLFQPDEVFLTNSVRGIMPVGRWGEARFPAPGPVTRRLWDEILPWLESGGTT